MRATVAYNPATPLAGLEYVLNDVDMVLIMTVNPGFGGQEFIHAMLPKVRQCRQMIDALQAPVLLEVGGEVHQGTIDDLVDAAADIFVAGSAVFSAADYAGNMSELKKHMVKKVN